MITKRRLALLSTLSAAPAFAAPFLAIGDNAELFLTARTEARYEDNVTFAGVGQPKTKDEIFEVVPGAELLFGKNSLTQGSFKAYERLLSYSDHTDLNDQLSNLVFNSKYSGAKLNLGANASFNELFQNSRDTAGNPDSARRDAYAAGLDGEYALTEKSKVGLAGRYSRTDYVNKASTSVGQTNYTVPANYYFAVAEKIDLSAGVQYRKIELAKGNPGSDDYYFNVGSRGEFTSKLSGKFNVGYNLRKSEDSTVDDETGLGFNAGLAYAYTPKTSFTLDLSRDLAVGSDTQGTENTSVMIGAVSNLTVDWAVNVNLGYNQISYMAGNRTDDYFVGAVGVTYTYNEYVNFEAGYTYNDNSSDLAAATFTANVIRFAANFRY